MSELDPEVKTAIRRWARAASLCAASKALAAARRSMTDRQRAELVGEVAEIAAETLSALLQKKDLEEPGETIDVLGMSMSLPYAHRISSWIDDQARTSAALEIDREAWAEQLRLATPRAFERRARLAATHPPAEDGGKNMLATTAQVLAEVFGGASTTFENRPQPGSSARSGLSGLLRTRSFASKRD